MNNSEIKALGFGCASLTSLNDNKQALNLLAVAYDCGIRHFDVARLYGYGFSESLLGKFAKDKRTQITITTKFGLNPPALPGFLGPLIATGKKILRNFPAVRKRLDKRGAKMVKTNNFTLEECEKNLKTSLASLQTDYLDFYLLHECEPTDAANREIFDFLCLQKAKGIIREFGVGTNFKNVPDIISNEAQEYKVFQFENSILNPNLIRYKSRKDKLFFAHSSLRDLEKCSRAINENNDVFKPFVKKWDVDLYNSSTLAGLLLLFNHYCNPGVVSLFSTLKPERIQRNIDAFLNTRHDDQMFEELRLKLIQTVQ